MAKPQIQSLQVFRGRAALAVVAHRAVVSTEMFNESAPDSEPGQFMPSNQTAARQRLEFSACLTARAWIAGAWIAGQARNDKGRGRPVIPSLTRDPWWRGQPSVAIGSGLSGALEVRAWVAPDQARGKPHQARNDKGGAKLVIPGLTRDPSWRCQPCHETASACLKPLPCGHGLRVEPAMTDGESAHGAMTKNPCHPGLDPGSMAAG